MSAQKVPAGTYPARIKAVFQPNPEGISDWISVETLIDLGFPWTKNGNIRRGAPWNDKIYDWDFHRKNDNPKGEILALRTVGFSTRQNVSSAIRSDIVAKLKANPFCNFSLLPVPKRDQEVDHRYGYKEHSKYSRINDLVLQKIDDFQLLHHAQNVQKRQMCVECVETKIRPKHPFKDFVEGSSQLDDTTVCNGCYLAEPERYR